MKNLIILFSLISKIITAQNYTVGDLLTELQQTAYWDYSRVKLHLTSNNIAFEENVNINNQKYISTESEYFDIRYTFNNNNVYKITVRFSLDQGGNDIKDVYYAYLGVYPQNAYGQWLTKLGQLTVYTTYSEKINGFIISKD